MTGSEQGIRLKRKKSDVGVATAFLAPTVFLIVLVTIIPIFLAIRTSFYSTNYAEVGEFVGVSNYISVFTGAGLLTLSEETRPIRGGFILVDGPVEVNCSFETLLRIQREKLEKPAAEILFGA